MNYWPGTKIMKSQGNAFDWRRGTSVIANDKFIKMSQASTAHMAGTGTDPRKTFTIYSKAKVSK